jgi:hypothetical protein
MLLTNVLLDTLAHARSGRAQPPVPLSPGVAIAASPSASAGAPLWAPVGAAGAHAWGAPPMSAAPFTPDSAAAVSSTMPRLTPASSIRGFAPPGQAVGEHRSSIGGDGSGLFGNTAGDGDGVKPLTPMFAGARWGSGIGAPGSVGGAPLPALQPLVGSFSMGTGLGLGTLLRGFGTDADGGGIAAEDGGFGHSVGGGGHGDAPLFGTPLPHAPFCSGDAGGGDGGSLLFPGVSSSLGASGLPLGSSALDLVPRSIASVWGPPGPSPAGTAASAPQPAQSSEAAGATGGAAPDAAVQQPQHVGTANAHSTAERAAALSNSGSSGLLSVRGNAAGPAADSSVPDTEGTASPLSATGSEGHTGSVGGKALAPEATPSAASAKADPGAAASASAAPTEAETEPGDAAVDSVGDASLEGEDAPSSEEHADDTAEDAAVAEAPRKLTGWALVAAKTPPKLQRGAGAASAASAPRSGGFTVGAS